MASNRITDTHSGRYWQLDFELKQAWLTRRVQVLRERDGGTT